MNEDERKDDIIRRAANGYNRPPATPSDEMWTAIQAARAIPRLHVAAGGAAAPAGYKGQARFAPRFAWLGAAAAALILVATGIGIGRFTSSPAAPAVAVTKQPVAVAQAGPDAPAHAVALEAEVPKLPSGASASTASIEAPAAYKSRSRDEIRKSPRIVGGGELRLASGLNNEVYGSRDAASTSVSYQVATQKHLENAEALLTSFALEGRDARMDAQFAGWAKGLLSNTRLLLDSPAGNDPRRAKLLSDLELVLAQIVQLSPNAPAQDRELIQGSIQNGHVMTRLRSAIPADQSRGITEK